MNASAAFPGRNDASIDPQEAEHFGRLAADWWNPKGSSAMLHRMNPARLGYIREATNQHWGIDEHERRPLAGKRALDIGCGAGLLAEPLARLGAAVTGIDAAAENIEAARAHAAQSGLAIDYRTGGIEALDGRFDLVTCLEVIEHVAEVRPFMAAIVRLLNPGGVVYVTTPDISHWRRPRDLDKWDGFNPPVHCVYFNPASMRRLLESLGLEVVKKLPAFKPGMKFIARKPR